MKTIINIVALVVVCVQALPLPEDDDNNYWERSDQFEGDMILADGQRNGILDKRFRWPKAELPYEIGPEYHYHERVFIKAALTAFDKTCLKVRPRKRTDKHYVLVTSEKKGCFSNIGRQGGMQKVNLNKRGCLTKQTVVHEFIHAAGFYHMQSNTNRDEYVRIFWDNIIEDMKFNFDKYDATEITDHDLPYDYKSIMHYSRKAFSKNGKDTIVPTKSSVEIGTFQEMSYIDKTKLNLMYC